MEMEKKLDTESGRLCFRPYTDKDQQKVVDLWQTVFHSQLPLELWKWKYHDSPYGNRAIICLNENEDVIVFFGGIPFRANLQGMTRKIIQLMDIMSHPDYRGTHVFGLTVSHFFDCYCQRGGAEMLYGFPGRYHYDIGVKYLGYVGLDQKVAYLTADIESMKSEDIKKILFKKNIPLSLIENSRIVKTRRPDFRFTLLFWQQLKHFPFSIQRNADFLRWRFSGHPVNSYEIWYLQEGSLPFVSAYAVFKIDTVNSRVIIVDFLSPQSDGLISVFMTKLIDNVRTRGFKEIISWLPEKHFITRSLISLGFKGLDDPLGIISTIRPFDHSPETKWISEHLYYTMADADLF